MSCAVCGAPMAAGRSHCLICGGAKAAAADQEFDRTVEAAAFEDVSLALEKDETLMGVTRGRVMGGWRMRNVLNPRALMTPFANIGLTSGRFMIQAVVPATGRAIKNSTASIPLSDLYSVTAADADPVAPGKTVRLVLTLPSGENLRVKVNGRLAGAAREIAEVWGSLYGRPDLKAPDERCARCERSLDKPYRFCPYCGAAQEED